MSLSRNGNKVGSSSRRLQQGRQRERAPACLTTQASQRRWRSLRRCGDGRQAKCWCWCARCRRALRLFLRTPSSERLPQLFHLDARQSAFEEAAKKHARFFSVTSNARAGPPTAAPLAATGRTGILLYHSISASRRDGQAASGHLACCCLLLSARGWASLSCIPSLSSVRSGPSRLFVLRPAGPTTVFLSQTRRSECRRRLQVKSHRRLPAPGALRAQ